MHGLPKVLVQVRVNVQLKFKVNDKATASAIVDDKVKANVKIHSQCIVWLMLLLRFSSRQPLKIMQSIKVNGKFDGYAKVNRQVKRVAEVSLKGARPARGKWHNTKQFNS